MGTGRVFRTQGAHFAMGGSTPLLAAILSLLVGCGGGQPQRQDAGDASGLDSGSADLTQPPVDAPGATNDAPAASADGSAGDVPADVRVDISADAAEVRPDTNTADVPADTAEVQPDTAMPSADGADAPADGADAPDDGADASADAADASVDMSIDTGPVCTLGTVSDCAACGDPACPLANTLIACTSADRCARAVCDVGFGNCNASSPDCETSFAAGGACLPRHRGTTAFATDYIWLSSTTIATDGSFFLVGSFRGTLDFDPTAAEDVHSAAGPADIAPFITKLNADGSYAWTRSYSQSGVGFGGAAAAPGGAVVVVGDFYGSIDLDPGPGVDMHQASTNAASGRQAMIVKLASDGSLVWGRTFFEGTTYRSYSSLGAAAVDATGAVYVGGIFTSAVDFDPGPGTVVRTAPLVGDAVIVKLTPAGDFSWVQTINDGDCHTQLASLAIATDGTVWGVGWTGLHPGCDAVAFPRGPESQPLIAAYTTGGDVRGLWRLPPAESQAYGSGVAAGANGSVYVAGSAAGLIDLDPGSGVATRWAGPMNSGFLLKLASDASLIWAEALPGFSVSRIAPTSDGGVLLGGHGSTAIVAKVGPDGTAGWTFALGGPNGSADGVAARGTSFVVAGSNENPGDFDPGPGTAMVDRGRRFLSRFDF